MLVAAGSCMAELTQAFNEAKALVAKYKANLTKPERVRYRQFMPDECTE